MCEPHWLLLSFVTYSAAPARRLSFAYPSLILRLSFAQPSSHTRLCLLADFPSVRAALAFILRSSYTIKVLLVVAYFFFSRKDIAQSGQDRADNNIFSFFYISIHFPQSKPSCSSRITYPNWLVSSRVLPTLKSGWLKW